MPRRKLEAGQAYAGLMLLAQRLEALGDLPVGTPLPERFDGMLVTGLQAFQERHGLVTDGVLGRATLQQLISHAGSLNFSSRPLSSPLEVNALWRLLPAI